MSYQDSSWMQQDQVEFHNIVIWGRLAEVVEQYVKKWAKLFLEWRLWTKSWEDQNGVKRYKTEAICNEMIMLSSKNTETTTSKKEESKNWENINIEEVPF
jgi:single-strand DNA-binding protein